MGSPLTLAPVGDAQLLALNDWPAINRAVSVCWVGRATALRQSAAGDLVGRAPGAVRDALEDVRARERGADLGSPLHLAPVGNAHLLALQRLAGNRAVTRALGLDVHHAPQQVSRLTTTEASLGETGVVGQVKALVGQSNYVKIKEELAKYYQAKQPQVRRQQLNKMLGLIATWMKANARSTTSGNLARMQRLHALRSEILQELALPALSGVGKQAAGSGALLDAEAATIPEPELTGVGKEAKPGQALEVEAATIPEPGLTGVGKEAKPGQALEVEATATEETAITAEAGPLVPPQADAVTKKLRQLKAQTDASLRVADKVRLLKEAQTELEQLLPLLTDPALATVRRAVSDYAQTMLQALPALEEQAEYMMELEKGQEKFAYLSLAGVRAVANAVDLARGATSAKPGMTDEAADIMRKASITDAEMAAIKIYTAPDYRYINAGLAKNRGAWLQGALETHTKEADPRAKDTRILGEPLAPGHLGPLSPGDAAAAEGVRHGKFAVEGLKKLPAWTGDTYRGMGLSPADFKAQFEDTDVWSTNAFTSTSAKEDVSKGFARQESKAGKVGFLMQFQVTNGRDINKLSTFGNEGEILLMPGASAKILRIEVDNGPPQIKVVYLRQTS